MFGFDWVEEKLPYLTLPPTSYCWNLELVVLDVSLSLSLSYQQTDNPPKVREGTTASSVYTVLPYLANSVVLAFLPSSFSNRTRIYRKCCNETEKKGEQANQPTNQPVGLTAL